MPSPSLATEREALGRARVTLLCTARREQVSEVAMVAEHEDHNKKQSNAMWHIKLQDTPCVLSASAPSRSLVSDARRPAAAADLSDENLSAAPPSPPTQVLHGVADDRRGGGVGPHPHGAEEPRAERNHRERLAATTYFKLALVMYVLALGALVYLKYFGSFSFGEEKVDPKAKRGGRGGKPKKGK